MRMRIIPTNKRGCCAVPLTPASPTMPIANPAAKPEKPTARPAPRWMKPLKKSSINIWKMYYRCNFRGQTILSIDLFRFSVMVFRSSFVNAISINRLRGLREKRISKQFSIILSFCDPFMTGWWNNYKM